jgi:hypothetical protein
MLRMPIRNWLVRLWRRIGRQSLPYEAMNAVPHESVSGQGERSRGTKRPIEAAEVNTADLDPA